MKYTFYCVHLEHAGILNTAKAATRECKIFCMYNVGVYACEFLTIKHQKALKYVTKGVEEKLRERVWKCMSVKGRRRNQRQSIIQLFPIYQGFAKNGTK